MLVASEILPTSKMSVTNFAGETNVGERVRGARHTVATLLVADMCDVTFTRFFVRLIYVPFGHGNR